MRQAVVIGSGHNGLVAAAYLARAGWAVTVLERRDVVGGATVTEELAPGFRVSTASYSLSLLRPRIHAELDLATHGLVIQPKDPQLFAPLPGGRHLLVWRDPARTRSEIERIAPGDADGYARYGAFLDAAVRLIRPAFEAPEPPALADLERQLPEEVFRHAIVGSASETVSRFFASDELRGIFGSQGIIGASVPPSAPGTAWVLTYHALGGELCGATGTWAYVRGGMGGVSRALAAAAAEAGAAIRTSAPVARVVQERDRVRGVVLEDGTEIGADAVLSCADPVRTGGLMEAVPERYAQRLSAWRTASPVVKVNLALRELPSFVSSPGTEPAPQHAGTIEVSPSLGYLEEAYAEAAGGAVSRRPWMEVFIQSVTDPTLAPGGGHVLSAFAQYAPSGLSDALGRISDADRAGWERLRAAAGDAVVETLAEHAPNLPDAIVARQVLGPPDLEDRFGLTGGNIFHGEMTPEQCFDGRFTARTGVRGLYLCGSGAHPGGAVTGAPGRNAAHCAMSDA
ncbi:MAG TPA: NAD(P)/FAD-dependent oxidoreductase [Actinomycetota bacterium]|nr:NAD(P)/FAD-dependent oxidoreductase [Actinomycetota bacterium]